MHKGTIKSKALGKIAHGNLKYNRMEEKWKFPWQVRKTNNGKYEKKDKEN